MSTTIRGRREELGLSLEEVAERIGVTSSTVRRWEEIGLDYEPGSRAGDYLVYLVGRIMEALEVEEGLLLEHVPSKPKIGDMVITPGPGVDIEDLIGRAGELNVRITVPDRFGLSLKPLKDGLTEEDYAAIAGHFERERAYSESVVRRMEATLELLGGNSGEWKEGQTMGERLGEVERGLGEDLDGLGEDLERWGGE